MSPFNANNQFKQQQEQMKRLQEQQKQQQDLLRRQQQMGAYYEAEKKKKQQQQIQNAITYGKKQGGQDVLAGNAQPRIMTQGGVNIHGTGDVSVGGDIIGRDKKQDIHVRVPVEEKSGCAFAIERTVTFVLMFFVSALIFGIILGGIGLGLLGTPGAAVGAAIAAVIGLGVAISSASNVKRTKG